MKPVQMPTVVTISEPEVRIISIPRHPDDVHIPTSTMHVVLPSGRIATVHAPLFSKTMDMLHDTLLICKDAIVSKPEDYTI